jgi:hypothetical protein
LANSTDLNLNNVTLTGNDSLINVSNENANVNLNGTVIDGNISGSVAFDLTNSGISSLNGNTSNANLVNNGNLTNNGNFSGSVVNNQGASFTSNASNINDNDNIQDWQERAAVVREAIEKKLSI